jgi:acetate kinase
MNAVVLVVNAGSSSVKYQVVSMPDETRLAHGVFDRVGELGSGVATHDDAFAHLVSALPEGIQIDTVGHRVVHGGTRFTQPTIITSDVIVQLEELSALAPLHNPTNIQGIRSAMRALPLATHVAVFDTAFFSTLPDEAATYALSKRLRDDYGIRRFGFHGTSHEYVSGELARLSSSPRRVITCHLGNGSSMAAIVDGSPIDTTMGFTPLPGLVMGTRSGDIDPAIIFHLLRSGMSAEEVEEELTKRAGLVGLTGSVDMRDIISRAESGDEDCELALHIWARRIGHYVGAYWALMGGLDALVLTGGIGENSAVLRQRIIERLDPIGVRLNPEKNSAVNGAGAQISSGDSDVSVWVIRTDEEIQIARHSHLKVAGDR